MRLFAEGDNLSPIHINSILKAEAGQGVGIGADVVQQTTTDNFKVYTGLLVTRSGTHLTSVDLSGSTSAGSRDATYPRRNLVIFDVSAGAVAVLAGTPASVPECPSLADQDDIVLGEVYLPPSGGATATFYDARAFVPRPCPSSFLEEFAYTDLTNLWAFGVLNGGGNMNILADSIVNITANTGVGNSCYLQHKFWINGGKPWWLRGYFKFGDTYAAAKLFGIGSTPTDLLSVGHTSASNSYFSIYGLDNSTPFSAVSSVALDTNWHHLDLINTTGRGAAAWLDGVLLGQVASQGVRDYTGVFYFTDYATASASGGISVQWLELLHSVD